MYSLDSNFPPVKITASPHRLREHTKSSAPSPLSGERYDKTDHCVACRLEKERSDRLGDVVSSSGITNGASRQLALLLGQPAAGQSLGTAETTPWRCQANPLRAVNGLFLHYLSVTA